VLKEKPAEMLELSSKATVPVLCTEDNKVIEQSIDIMHWALKQSDPDSWLQGSSSTEVKTIIEQNDGEFKHYLDRYKYHVGYPEHSQSYYRERAELFLQRLESLLNTHDGKALSDKQIRFADVAVFPFVRQFANVEPDWFFSTSYTQLIAWYRRMKEGELFQRCMKKYSQWTPDTPPVYFPG
jgi:glutathione S-transferase